MNISAFFFFSDLQLEFLLLKLSYLNNLLKCMVFKLIFFKNSFTGISRNENILIEISVSSNIVLGYSLNNQIKLSSKICQKHLIHNNCNCSIWYVHIFINICREMSWSEAKWSKINTSMKFNQQSKKEKKIVNFMLSEWKITLPWQYSLNHIKIMGTLLTFLPICIHLNINNTVI